MKKLFIVGLIGLIGLMGSTLQAQTDWRKVEKLIDDGSYKTAYSQAEGVYKRSANSAERLAAAYHMTLAASHYQEDVHDSAEARYRALLPKLEPLEKALCFAFLGEYDSALVYADVLKATPVEKIKMYCNTDKGENMTPTAFDVVVLQAQDNGSRNPQQRVELQRQLLAFHAADGDDLRLWHEIRLLNMLSSVPNRRLTVDQIKEVLERYRDSKSPLVTNLYHRIAFYYNSMEDYVQALCYCDTAIARAPKSEGGINCANLRNEIKQKLVEMHIDGLVVAPGAPSLQRVRYRNLDRLWWRIIPYDEDYRWSDKTKANLRAAKALESGEWRVERGKDYRYAESYVSLPAMKTGKYLLLVSPSEDFKADGFMAYEVNVTDMYLIQNGQEGLLLDRRTGKPIAGQELLLKSLDYRNTKLLERTHTDSNGRYRFTTKEYHYNYKIIIERDGYTLDASYGYAHEAADTTMKLNATLRTDRPIYKPGDTLQVAVVVFRSNGLDARVATNEQLELLLSDPNYQEVEKKTLTADDFGVVHTDFVIPTDRIAGMYILKVSSVGKTPGLMAKSVRVEEYKQPKFMVKLGDRTYSSALTGTSPNLGEELMAPQFGQPYTVHGLAASYSAVPVSGARVQYSVRREMMHRWWWRYWGWHGESTEVATGELTTAADGSFAITFTPEPDSSVELSTKPNFCYTVTAIVTDLNGESHEQTHELRVGFQNAFLALDGPEEVRTLDGLKPRFFDLNGNPLDGKVDMQIDRLWQPATPLLDPPVMIKGARQTMNYDEFRKAYPLYAYSEDWNDRDTWLAISDDGKRTDASGVYRITLTAPDADTLVVYRTVTAEGARHVQSQQLLWTDVDKQKAEVGETVRLRFGSRFKEVDVYYLLRIGDEVRDFRRINVNDELKYIDIPVDSAMLGGFHIDLVALREGIKEEASFSVTVPFSHKDLKVEIATFRDKLLPGETEEWTVRVKSSELGVKSTMVMTMYDDALNSYENQDWGFSPWRTNSTSHLRSYYIRGGAGHWLEEYKHLYYNGTYPSVWTLKEALPYYNRWGRRMYRTAAMAKNSTTVRGESGAIEEEEEMELSVVEDDAVVMQSNAVQVLSEGDGGSSKHEQVRTNLNTLAFFAPALRTNADGTLTYRFTVPELLTRWNVKGLAFTKDLKIGTLDKTLITSKPLMVQPNMPRFLRSGDSLALMAKVVLVEPTSAPQEVSVTLFLTDAATGDTITLQHRQVTVKDAAQVTFPIQVPSDVYVATYQIIAVAKNMSDGERGQIPVVSSRQAVTLSQPVYINGAGEKHFNFQFSILNSSTATPHFLGAELVSNPVWLAIKSMPYLKQQENPSTIYLANSLYVNTLAKDIIETIGSSVSIESLSDTSNTRLKINEDVKQTLLEATPWVRDAESEVEQRQAIVNYFDSSRLTEEFAKLNAQLASRQNSDGGWSWMPEGESSTWVTLQVLKRLSGSSPKLGEGNRRGAVVEECVGKALAYVDREEQRHYEKYIKPYLKKYKWEPDNIDYLYTRSFYGKGTTEAYKFYYKNALKNYKKYKGLYTQAQLALIFQRHGDKQAAHDLVRRLKEKSLQNDEMGIYWRDNKSGWCWYERPIETQALLIQAFREVTPQDTTSIALMQQWLLKQKQTTHWGNDRATVEAISALMTPNNPNSPSNPNTLTALKSTTLTLCGVDLTAPSEGLEGYRSQRWVGPALDSVIALGDSTITLRKTTSGIAWGSVYFQYTDDMDKIPSSESGITLKRTYLDRNNQNILNTPDTLKVGDRIKVRIEISCDRTMEYLELIDGRPSCVEPLSTRAGWNWNQGLHYYVDVKNTATHCYVNRLEKGKYVVEYEVYVTNPGTFLAGPVTMQCMYAPEFRATAPATRLTVE